MNSLTVSQGSHSGMTMLSNRFIDEYMKDANDAQMKVYLYLLRCAGTNLPSGISAIADYFNFTEKDIMRALQYWDRQHVISLLYDDARRLVGIRLENLDSRPADIIAMPALASSVLISQVPSPSEAHTPVISVSPATAVSVPAESSPVSTFDKNSISPDQLKEFKNREETSQLLFIVEQYLGKPLSNSDIRSIFFMTDILHFSTDLIDYLVQYCVERGKKDFRYMEKVSINWAENNISTPKQAAAYAVKYDKNVYAVMNALGRTTSPTKREASYVHKWFQEYGFTLDIIMEACGRSVLATEKHRFEYTDGILQSWKENSVHSMEDIRNADAEFHKKKNTHTERSSASVNPFQQFKQNQYDYDELLEKIKIN